MEEQNKKERRKILIVSSICLLLIIIMAGFTYSYFVVRDTDTATITGTVASGELEIEVNQLAPTGNYQNQGLVPQLDTAIESAVKGTQGSCVDDNYNSVCRVYEVIVTNESNMAANLDGKIKLNAENNPNLKWALIQNYASGSKPTLEKGPNSYSEVRMVENESFGATGTNEATKRYYLVVWISETGGAQYDTGVFTGEIIFEPTIYRSYVLEKYDEIPTDVSDNFLSTDIPLNKIYSIEFINTSDAPENSIGTYDVSLIGDNSVLLYYTDSGNVDAGGQPLYDVHIGTATGTTIASSGHYLFSYLSKTNNIDFTNLDTSRVTDMSSMFKYAIVTTVDFGDDFDTSNVTDMNSMFEYAAISLNFGNNFNTSNVIDMSRMFYGIWETSDSSTLDLGNFNTSKVTNMSGMFSSIGGGLTSLNLSSFDTSKVTDMSNMFSGSFSSPSSLTSLNLSNFNTSKVTDMSWMFYYSPNLSNLNISNFDTSKVTNMMEMFGGCSGLTGLNLSSFDTSKVTNMGGMFGGCSGLTNLNISNFDTSKVTNMSGMFASCTNLTELDLSSFDTSKVTNMGDMFIMCRNLETIYASSGFITSSVTNSSLMFDICDSLVGGNGTLYNSSITDKTYARIDAAETPGYFTLKSA